MKMRVSRWSSNSARRNFKLKVSTRDVTTELGSIFSLTVTCLLLAASNGVSAQQPPLPPAQIPSNRLPPPPNVVLVPGTGDVVRDSSRVDRVIYPHDKFDVDPDNKDKLTNSYVFDNKRWVESYSSRCMASTLLEDPDSVEPSFIIITRRSEFRLNATVPVEAIRLAGFEPSLPSYILVHGFTQSYPETDWLRKSRALFELHSLIGRANLIFMDWGVASQGSYAQVAARASGMGSFLANFLMKLFELGADRNSVHIVGHSLGAHVAGFAGKRIRPRVGRITGLDAAGPCFGKFFSNSPNDRLSADDAVEVAVYHYDDSFLGLSGQIGQFDVLVNGGSSQPGAKDNMNAMAGALVTMVFRRNRPLSESHTRSTEVATSQLSLTNCQMIAYECRDWPAFLSGECGFCDPANSQCFDMALPYQYANRPLEPKLIQANPHKRFFIATSSANLFCLNHFQVVVRFEPSPDFANLAKKQRWRVHLELVNDLDAHTNLTISNQVEPLVYTHLMLSESQPSRFRMGILQVRQGDNKPVQLREKEKFIASRPYSNLVRVRAVEVNFMSSVNPDKRQALSSRLCPRGWLDAENSIDDSSFDDNDSEWLALDKC